MARDPIVSDKLFSEFATLDDAGFRSTKTLESLITTGLESYNTALLIIDGLDEATTGESAKSLKWLLSLIKPNSKLDQTAVRLLICGQRDGILDGALSSIYPTISLESSSEHAVDIQKYCASVCSQMRHKFGKAMTAQLEEDILSLVSHQTCGEWSCL